MSRCCMLPEHSILAHALADTNASQTALNDRPVRVDRRLTALSNARDASLFIVLPLVGGKLMLSEHSILPCSEPESNAKCQIPGSIS